MSWSRFAPLVRWALIGSVAWGCAGDGRPHADAHAGDGGRATKDAGAALDAGDAAPGPADGADAAPGALLGGACDDDADCAPALRCRSDEELFVAHRQCTAPCGDDAACVAMFGTDSFCIGAGVCVLACTRQDACPEHTVCGSAGWCERSGPTSGNPYCDGASPQCAALDTRSACRAVTGCAFDSDCSGIAERCDLQTSATACVAQDGCDWNASSTTCSGVANACAEYAGQVFCEAQRGCTWSQDCSGTPESCDAKQVALCAAQPGCVVIDPKLGGNSPLPAQCVDDEGCETGMRCSQQWQCVDVDECAEARDDCDADPKATCEDMAAKDGGYACRCPKGFSGSGHGDAGCAAGLTSLEVDPGVLAPQFDPDVREYRVRVALGTAQVQLSAGSVASTGVSIAGAASESGSAQSTLPLHVGANSFGIDVAYAGATSHYEVIVERGAIDAYLKASNAEAGDGDDGFAVAVSGDTVAVGVPAEASAGMDQDDNSAARSGAVYVFVRDGNGWRQQAYVKAPNAEAADLFGASVAIDGDVLVVGAPWEDGGSVDQLADNSADASGAAYVFTRSGETWTFRDYLKAGNRGAGDVFGTRVAVQGDMLVVTAPGEASKAVDVNGSGADDDAPDSGAAYVYTGAPGAWVQQAFLKAAAHSSERLGMSLALSGDLIAIGAPRHVAQSTHAGRAYVFARSGSQWSAEHTFDIGVAGADFGWRVALDADILVITAPSQGRGQAYVYERSAGQWPQKQVLAPADDTYYYGAAVALRGSTLLMNGGAVNVDAVRVFALDGEWVERASFQAGHPDSGDGFGADIAFDGETIAIAAPGEASAAHGVDGNQSDNSAPGSGAVYVIR